MARIVQVMDSVIAQHESVFVILVCSISVDSFWFKVL